MTIWNSFIKLLWKLQCFNWLGSIIWSLIPVPVFAVLIPTLEKKFGLKVPIMVLGIFTTILQGLFLVMIPQCNLRFREYIRPLIKDDSEMTHGMHSNVMPPPKKICIIALLWLILFLIQVPGILDQKLIVSVGASALMPILYVIYTLAFEILFGSLTNTLIFQCKQITADNVVRNLERSALILRHYENLKKASELGLLCVTALSTILTISSIYAMVASLAYTCFNMGGGVTQQFVPGLQVMAYVSTFLIFANMAHNCFENFQGMSDTLR